MEKLKWHTETRRVDDLIPAEYNPRQMTESQVAKLTRSLEKFDLVEIPAINTDGTILAGHQRLHILSLMGRGSEEIDVRVPNRELTDREAKEYNVISNKVTGEWDFDKLFNLPEDLLKDAGFDDKEIQKLIDGHTEAKEDDFDVDESLKKESNVKRGEIWQLGTHRLMCGDSTKKEDVERLMDGKKADIVFQSPPYNAGKNVRGNFYENDSDDKTDEDWISLIEFTTLNAIENSDFAFVNLQMLEGNKYALIDFQYRLKDYLKDILIWNKTQYPPHINKGTFGTKWEYVFCFSKDSKSRGFPCDWQGKYPNVIETENASGNEFAKVHKATFPIAFPMWIIQKMDFAKIILDLFGGSGSTLIACEQTKRICYMMEIDEHYCQVIIDRWEKLTGGKAIKLA